MNPATANNNKLQVVSTDDQLRKELVESRRETARLNREMALTEDLTKKSELVAQCALRQQAEAAILKRLGLSALPSLKGKKAAAGPLPARLISTEELTMDQLLTLSAAGRCTQEGAVAISQVQGTAVVTAWVPPQFNAFPDAGTVAAFFAPAKTMTPVAPVLRSPKDPFFKKEGGLKNFATTMPTAQFVGQDGEWIANLQQLPPRFEEHRERVHQLLQQAVAGYYVGSGPVEGWFKRLLAGDARPHPKFQLTAEEKKAVYAALPFDPARVATFIDVDLLEIYKRIKVNGAAGCGFPRQKKKAEVAAEMYADASQYYELMCKKEFVAYQRLHPGEFLTTAKAKLDRYEVSDWGKKIRPYYNANGGLALLYSCIIQTYSAALLGFWEHPESVNAHGFAWNSGGGDRLYAWVAGHTGMKPGVYATGYSDDGLWIVITEDGEIWICDKDIAQCDASCGDDHLPQVREHVSLVLAGKLTQGWDMIKNASVQAIFSQLVIVYKSLVYHSRNKVHSGLPGTAEADQVAFATAFVLVRDAYARQDVKVPWRDRFQKAEAQLAERTGLTFKPSQWHKFTPNQPSYPWSFLGKTLVRWNGHYVPMVSEAKCIVQLVTPKQNRGGLEGQRSWMERARGLAVTSLYWHPHLFEVARAAYQRKVELGVRPAATMDGAEAETTDLVQIMGTGMELKFPDDKFPRWEWIMLLYTGAIAGAPVQAIAAIQPKKTAADCFDEQYPAAEEVPGTAWADAPQDPLPRLAAQLALVEGQRIEEQRGHPVRPGPDQYTLAPLPQGVKEEYAAHRIAYARAMSMAKAGLKRGGYYTGGAVDRLENSRDPDLVFTRDGVIQAWKEATERDEDDVWAADESEFTEYAAGQETDVDWGRRMEKEAAEHVEQAWERSERRRAAKMGRN